MIDRKKDIPDHSNFGTIAMLTGRNAPCEGTIVLLNWVILWTFVFFLSVPAEVIAQRETADPIEGEVIINKDLQIELPAAQRTFEKIPPPALDPKQEAPQQYNFQLYDVALPDLPAQIRVLRLKDDAPPKVEGGNYLNAGFGTYFTPYLEVGLSNLPGGKGQYGFQYRHLSSRFGPIDKENSGSGQNYARLYGELAGKQARGEASLLYRRDAGHFYGYPEGTPVLADTIVQVFNRFALGLGAHTADFRNPLQIGFSAMTGYISDYYDASEFSLDFLFKTSYVLKENLKTDLKIGVWHGQYKNPGLQSRSLVRMLPTFEVQLDDLRLIAGINAVYNNDTLNYKSTAFLYPHVEMRYKLEDWVSLFADLKGDMETVSFGSIVDENMFISPGVPISHRSKRLEMAFGARGNFIKKISFESGISIASFKNFHYFLNDPEDESRFSVLYDGGNTRRVTPYLNLSAQVPRKYGTSLRLQYFGYQTDQIAQPWHLPEFETDFAFWYLFYGKVKASFDAYIITGMVGPDWNAELVRNQPAPRKLNAIADLNLKLDYLFSEKFGFFVQLSNLLNNQNPVYSNYYRRGLMGMVGISANL